MFKKDINKIKEIIRDALDKKFTYRSELTIESIYPDDIRELIIKMIKFRDTLNKVIEDIDKNKNRDEEFINNFFSYRDYPLDNSPIFQGKIIEILKAEMFKEKINWILDEYDEFLKNEIISKVINTEFVKQNGIKILKKAVKYKEKK